MGLSIFRGLFKKKTELSDKEKFDGAMKRLPMSLQKRIPMICIY